MGFFNNKGNDNFTGDYMNECPKCGHRYNRTIHGNKCPDCGYRKFDSTVFVIILVVLAILFVITTFFSSLLNGIFRIFNPVIILIIINVVVYIKSRNNSYIGQDYGNSYDKTIARKQYYRLITSGFVHANIIHLICNMWSLYNIGNFVYSLVGPLKFVIFYFICLALGGLLSAFFHHNRGEDFICGIGASGAICGLLGIYICFFYKMGISSLSLIRISFQALFPLLITAFYQNVDNIGHISGLVVGLVIGLFFL